MFECGRVGKYSGEGVDRSLADFARRPLPPLDGNPSPPLKEKARVGRGGGEGGPLAVAAAETPKEKKFCVILTSQCGVYRASPSARNVSHSDN